MSDFTYYAPTKVLFGRQKEMEAAKEAKALGATKVLIHYGSKSSVKSGLLERVCKNFDEASLPYVTLGGVLPNPRLDLVREGIELCRKEGIDFILAIGGGSTIDSAKAIGYGVSNDFDVWKLFTKEETAKACLPIGVILTIAASGSEMSGSCVITNSEGLKRSCSSRMSRPKFACMNPELTMTLPPYQTASGCVDILMHTLERYFTNGDKMEITDAIAEGLLRTVIKNALILKDEPDNYNARAEIMWAGSLSHNGLTGCGNEKDDFASHKLEHELGGMFDVAHGAGLAAVWGSWARYCLDSCLHRFVKFAVNVMEVELGVEATSKEIALAGIEALENFFRKISMPVSIKELGINPSEEQLIEMARLCAEGVKGKTGSAKVLTEPDFLEIYKMAM